MISYMVFQLRDRHLLFAIWASMRRMTCPACKRPQAFAVPEVLNARARSSWNRPDVRHRLSCMLHHRYAGGACGMSVGWSWLRGRPQWPLAAFSATQLACLLCSFWPHRQPRPSVGSVQIHQDRGSTMHASTCVPGNGACATIGLTNSSQTSLMPAVRAVLAGVADLFLARAFEFELSVEVGGSSALQHRRWCWRAAPLHAHRVLAPPPPAGAQVLIHASLHPAAALYARVTRPTHSQPRSPPPPTAAPSRPSAQPLSTVATTPALCPSTRTHRIREG